MPVEVPSSSEGLGSTLSPDLALGKVEPLPACIPRTQLHMYVSEALSLDPLKHRTKEGKPWFEFDRVVHLAAPGDRPQRSFEMPGRHEKAACGHGCRARPRKTGRLRYGSLSSETRPELLGARAHA